MKMIKSIVAKILCKRLKKNYIIVDTLIPLKYIIVDDVKITGKGMMYMKYIEENPNGTMEEFNELYEKTFK